MKRKKRIALVAHDERKEDLLEWVKFNKKSWQHTNCGQREPPVALYQKIDIVQSKFGDTTIEHILYFSYLFTFN